MVGENMTLIAALIIWLVFFILLCGAFYAGWLVRGKQSPHTITADEQVQSRQQEIQKSFLDIMNYSEKTALQRKKVTHE